MTLTTSNQPASHTPYTGPLNHNDSLTDNELALLLAIPRLAEQNPNATMCRLPLGPDPTQGWVDVTFAEARIIVARLTADWKARLSNELNMNIGPGMTICLLVQPIAHAVLHWLAFWTLGCSIQVMSLSMDDDAIALHLKKSGCQVAIHSGITYAQLEGIRSGWNGTMIHLTEEEYAHQLALNNKQSKNNLALPWPEPQRPDPAIILHSSGSTGTARVLQLSLYHLTLGLPNVNKANAARFNITAADPRPFLIFSPPYWASFGIAFINQLVTGAPTAFTRIPDIAKCPSSVFVDWVRGLDAGAVVCAPRFIRDVLASGVSSNISLFQSMYTIAVAGSALDESTATLAEKHKLKLINVLGSTEFGTILLTNQPPYTHLRPFPGVNPLVHPISDTAPDGSRQVQFWFSPSTSPRLAHIQSKGGILVHFKPFPGEGPHKGEPAVQLDDILREVRSDSQVSYVYLGRSDDLIKLAGRGGWDINASAYENELAPALASHLASQTNESGRWAVDAVQLFGNNRPCTALVIQLSSVDHAEIDQSLTEQLCQIVERVNTKLILDAHLRVHPQKRMLIVTSEAKAYGPGVQDMGEDIPRLMVTHKHTLRRWENTERFRSWMDGLDYSEP